MADPNTNYYSQYYNSPVGWLNIQATDTGIVAVLFCETKESENNPNPLTAETQNQLAEYFENKRRQFHLPLEILGTPFQKRVWLDLLNIPFGKTISYLQLSKQIGNTKAIRAVGHANGQNPLPIIIPCHRVIGSDGSLTGYGGGLWRKKWLLKHEGSLPQTELEF